MTHRKTLKRHTRLYGNIPFGSTRSSDGIAIDNEKAAVVRLIFKLYGAGESMANIAIQLNEDPNIPPPKRGKKWRYAHISSILKREIRYRGCRFGQIPGNWPVILEDDND